MKFDYIRTLFETVQKKDTKCIDYWEDTAIKTNNKTKMLMDLVKNQIKRDITSTHLHLLYVYGEEIDKLNTCTTNLEKLIWDNEMIPLIITENNIWQLIDPITRKLEEIIPYNHTKRSAIYTEIRQKYKIVIILILNNPTLLTGDFILQSLQYDTNWTNIIQIITTCRSSNNNIADFSVFRPEYTKIAKIISTRYFDTFYIFIAIINMILLISNIIITIFFSVFMGGAEVVNISKNKKWKQWMLLLIILNIIFQIILIVFNTRTKHKLIAIFSVIMHTIFLFLYINWYDLKIVTISSIQTINISYMLFNSFMIIFFVTKELFVDEFVAK